MKKCAINLLFFECLSQLYEFTICEEFEKVGYEAFKRSIKLANGDQRKLVDNLSLFMLLPFALLKPSQT